MQINKKRYLFAFCTLSLLFSFSTNPINATEKEEIQKIRNQMIYDAEWEFSQSIIKAKEQYNQAKNNPNSNPQELVNALSIKNKAIADAQKVRDNNIAAAWKDFNTASSKLMKDKTTKPQKQEFCFLWWCW